MEPFYEDPNILSEYLLFHYGSDEEIFRWDFGPKESTQFPKRIAHLFKEHYPQKGDEGQLRALDIGCSVGRSSFELTHYADKVIGLDYSQAFIDAAKSLQTESKRSYSYKIQGNRRQETIASVPADCDPSKVTFDQADAMNLPLDELGKFDIVLASNLICRLPDPGKFMGELKDLVSSGGVFVLSTPYSYLEAFTETECWLGGTEGCAPFDAIKEVLNPNFTLLKEDDTPMLIREHERKFQWTVCHVSVWKRT